MSRKDDDTYRRLARRIMAGEGFGLEPETEALMHYEQGSERTVALHAVVLLRTDQASKAQTVIEAALKTHGETPVLLTNLAKAHAEQGHTNLAQTTVRRALDLDPNQDNGLHWWASLVRMGLDDRAFLSKLREVAQIEGSWRVHILIAQLYLEQNAGKKVVAALGEARRISNSSRTAMVAVSRFLQGAGQPDLTTEVLQDADPVRHGIVTASTLGQAWVAQNRLEPARKLLERCYEHGASSTSSLRFFEEALTVAERAKSSSGSTQLGVIRLEAPLYTVGLARAEAWLLPDIADAHRVAFLAFEGAGPAPEPGPVPPEDTKDVLRALPLALAASFRERGVASEVLLPTVDGRGLLSSSFELSWDEALALLARDRLPAFVVRGRSRALKGYAFEVEVFHLKTRKTTAFEVEAEAEAALVERAHEVLATHLQAEGVRFAAEDRRWGSPHVLTLYARMLAVYLVGAEAFAAELLSRPLAALEYGLARTGDEDGRGLAGVLVVGAFLAGRGPLPMVFAPAYEAIVSLLEDDHTPKGVRQLAPLVYVQCGEPSRAAAAMTRLRSGANPAYLRWLRSLSLPT